MEGKFSTNTEADIQKIETHLAEHSYISSGPLPGCEDACVFFSLKGAPDASKYFNFFHWFATISMFNKEVVKSWQDASKAECHKGEKKAEKKEEAKPAADDDDLFGEETEEDKAAAEALKLKKEQEKKDNATKKVKEVIIPKSIIVFDVKILEEEQDLDALAKKILEIKMDGLYWKTEYKKVPVAYNIKKLQMGCIVEDDKVCTDDLFDAIQVWEDEVQSVDVVSFQKVWEFILLLSVSRFYE